MRLFIAIDWTEKDGELKALQNAFSPVKARFPKDFHLTFKFIGEVSAEDCNWITAQLQSVVNDSFVLKVNSLGTFKSYSQKVIWCGLEKSLSLSELNRKIDGALEARFAKSTGFSPHITLARIKHPHKLKERDKALIDERLKMEVEPFTLSVHEFLLIESRLKPEGPIYKVIKRYPLY